MIITRIFLYPWSRKCPLQDCFNSVRSLMQWFHHPFPPLLRRRKIEGRGWCRNWYKERAEVGHGQDGVPSAWGERSWSGPTKSLLPKILNLNLISAVPSNVVNTYKSSTSNVELNWMSLSFFYNQDLSQSSMLILDLIPIF